MHGSELVNRPQASAAEVEARVRAVEDPELPHVTLDDLGIIRRLAVQASAVEVTLTPTFVGCPALEQMRDDVVAAIEGAGYEATVETSLSPPWSSDWITEEGPSQARARRHRASRQLWGPGATLWSLWSDPWPARAVARSTRRGSRTSGATACKAPYKCLDCAEPFEGFKPL